jgi:guanylate kinase
MASRNSPGRLFIISAPSGAGKTTLTNALLDDMRPAYALERVITYTTKSPRPGEVHGKDYYFVSVAEFEQKIQEGFFIEWSGAYGNYYGSPSSILDSLAQGTSFIMILDRAGARALQGKIADAVLIWIRIDRIDILHERLIKRGQDSEAQIVRRLALAQQEVEEEAQNRLFQHHIINDIFEVAVENIKNIIKESGVAIVE